METQTDMESKPIETEDSALVLVASAEEAWIDSQITMETGVELDNKIRQALKKLEDERKSFTAPLNDTVKKINARFKPITDHLEAARMAIQGKIGAYRREQERIRQEEAEKERKAQEEAILAEAQRLEAEGKTEEADRVVDQAPIEPVAPPPSQPSMVRGESSGTASFIREGAWTLVDLSKVPLMYMQVNESAINKAVKPSVEKGGIRDIPGLLITEQERMMNRG